MILIYLGVNLRLKLWKFEARRNLGNLTPVQPGASPLIVNWWEGSEFMWETFYLLHLLKSDPNHNEQIGLLEWDSAPEI